MQTVQTLIRLLLKEQSDQGLHYLPQKSQSILRQLHKKQNLNPKSIE